MSWDFGGRRGPLSPFWAAAREIDPGVEDESRRAGAQEGSLARLFEGAGLRDVEASVLSVAVEHPSFEEWWHPYTLGVGPAGAFVAGLSDDRIADLRERCRALLPEPPFVLTSCAWASRASLSPPPGSSTRQIPDTGMEGVSCASWSSSS